MKFRQNPNAPLRYRGQITSKLDFSIGFSALTIYPDTFYVFIFYFHFCYCEKLERRSKSAPGKPGPQERLLPPNRFAGTDLKNLM